MGGCRGGRLLYYVLRTTHPIIGGHSINSIGSVCAPACGHTNPPPIRSARAVCQHPYIRVRTMVQPRARTQPPPARVKAAGSSGCSCALPVVVVPPVARRLRPRPCVVGVDRLGSAKGKGVCICVCALSEERSVRRQAGSDVSSLPPPTAITAAGRGSWKAPTDRPATTCDRFIGSHPRAEACARVLIARCPCASPPHEEGSREAVTGCHFLRGCWSRRR